MRPCERAAGLVRALECLRESRAVNMHCREPFSLRRASSTPNRRSNLSTNRAPIRCRKSLGSSCCCNSFCNESEFNRQCGSQHHAIQVAAVISDQNTTSGYRQLLCTLWCMETPVRKNSSRAPPAWSASVDVLRADSPPAAIPVAPATRRSPAHRLRKRCPADLVADAANPV